MLGYPIVPLSQVIHVITKHKLPGLTTQLDIQT
jgi:hypothetical protein